VTNAQKLIAIKEYVKAESRRCFRAYQSFKKDHDEGKHGTMSIFDCARCASVMAYCHDFGKIGMVIDNVIGEEKPLHAQVLEELNNGPKPKV
jgi:hypothetical protein